MYGGHGNRKFYIAEVSRIDRQHSERVSKSTYSDEEIQAGFQNLSEAFGFYGTLLFMEKETPFNRDELLGWSVNKFNQNIVYLSHYKAAEKRYRDIKTGVVPL